MVSPRTKKRKMQISTGYLYVGTSTKSPNITKHCRVGVGRLSSRLINQVPKLPLSIMYKLGEKYHEHTVSASGCFLRRSLRSRHAEQRLFSATSTSKAGVLAIDRFYLPLTPPLSKPGNRLMNSHSFPWFN